MIESVIFDWAGTLVDDVRVALQATNETLVHFGGSPIDLPTYRSDFRVPVMEFYGPRIPGHSLEEIDSCFFNLYRRQMEDLTFFDGAEDLIRVARIRGCLLFVLTTLPESVVREFLEPRGLSDAFRAIYGNAADKRDVLPQILVEQNLEADEVLYVGDTPHDVAAARQSGVRSGAALYGHADPDALRSARPDYAFDNLRSVAEELDRDYLMKQVPLVIATVGGVIADGDGRILVIQTRKWSNLFGIPGGKIQYGETMLEAYEREIQEECGLSLRDTRLVMIQDCIESPEFVKKRHFLLVNYFSYALNPDELALNYEIDLARWVTPSEAMDLPLNAPTRAVLCEAAEQGLISFDQK